MSPAVWQTRPTQRSPRSLRTTNSESLLQPRPEQHQHTYTRDKAGRVTPMYLLQDQASTPVFSRSSTRTTARRIQKVSSHSDLIASKPATVNAMRYTYDTLWRLTSSSRTLGDIGVDATTGIVDIDYEDVGFNSTSTFGTHNISRATDLKYPLGAQGASSARTVLRTLTGPAASMTSSPGPPASSGTAARVPPPTRCPWNVPDSRLGKDHLRISRSVSRSDPSEPCNQPEQHRRIQGAGSVRSHHQPDVAWSQGATGDRAGRGLGRV